MNQFLQRLFVPRWTILHTGAAVGLLGLAGGWYLHVNEEPVVNIPNPQPPAVNAREDYLRAVSLLVNMDAVADALDPKHQLKKRVYSAYDKDALAAADEPALAALRAGFDKTFANLPARGFDARFPELTGYRTLARALRLEGDCRAAHGDYGGAVSSGLDAMRLGFDIPRGGVLIADLVGLACESVGRRPVSKYMDRLDADQAAAAARRLEGMDAGRFPYAQTLQEEKWCTEAGIVKEMHGRNAMQMSWSILEFPGESEVDDADVIDRDREKLKLCLAMVPYSKRDIVSGYANCMDGESALARLPYQQAICSPSPPVAKDPVNQILFPIWAQARMKDVTERMEDHLLIAELGLQSYRCRHMGANPPALENLVTEGILTRVPTDPFSMTGTAPLGYRLLPDGTCRLYSVGPDGIDNDGRPINNHRDKNHDARYWPEANDKGDWVVGVDDVRTDN